MQPLVPEGLESLIVPAESSGLTHTAARAKNTHLGLQETERANDALPESFDT